MQTTTLVRWSAPLFAIGAIFFAMFIIISNGEFTGAELGLSMRHHAAHVSHFWSALSFMFGIIGFYVAHRETSGVFGFVAFLFMMSANALFIGTGVITAFVWRTISANAPQLVAANGAFFDPPLAVIFLATVGFSVGMILLGVVAIRARLLPRGGAIMLIVGALMLLLPPQPFGAVPYFVLDIGAVIFALGAIWLSMGLWRVGSAAQSIGAATPSVAAAQ